MKAEKRFDVVLSCKDASKEKLCGQRRESKRVGGYASTYKGWFSTTYYITLCPIWFKLESLEDKTWEVEEQIHKGDLKYAQQAGYQKNQGQYFLHEMIHLEAVGDPHSKCSI